MEPPMRQWWPVFQELVQARSVFEDEHAAVAIVERAIAQLGLTPVPLPFEPERLAGIPGAQPPFSSKPGRRNLIATVRGAGGGRSLILNSHLDTVPEGDPSEWRHAPFSGAIENDVIFGRGAFDDKAGAVICLALLERATRRGLRGDVIAQFVLEDETTGNGTLLCLDRGPGADAAVIVDGTRGDRGINEHAGNVRFAVTVFGRSASVSVSHMGVNAAELLSRLVIEIRDAVLALNAANVEPWTQYPSPNQCAVVALDCRETTLTVPAVASATCYATFTPPHCLATFRELIASVVRGFADRQTLERCPELHWDSFAAEPVRSPSAALEQAIRRAAGTCVPFGPSTGTSDLRHFVARRIPCVLFGPGRGHHPHRPNESFELASLSETAEIIWRTVETWCA
jgi:acetylornithine deacetylase